jgi:hypothetical protein
MALCVCSTAALAQSGGLTFLPMDSEVTWNYTGPRETPGSTTAIYSETTSSGFFIPFTQNNILGVSDDLSGAVSIFDNPQNAPGSVGGFDNPDDWSITGFDFQYSLRASISQLPVTATVRFLGVGVAVNFITAEYGKVVINSLATGTIMQSVTLNNKIVGPKNMWMEIQFSPVTDLAATTRTEDVGWGIASDIHSEGASNPQGMGNSEDIFLITDGVAAGGAVNGASFFGGYTPILPTSDPNYTLPGNFLFSVYGKKVPEPMTMGLMAMGLTGIAALRRRR